MEFADIFKEVAVNYGLPGLMLLYMVWEKRFLGKERLESEKALTATLAALKTVIERLDR